MISLLIFEFLWWSSTQITKRQGTARDKAKADFYFIAPLPSLSRWCTELFMIELLFELKNDKSDKSDLCWWLEWLLSVQIMSGRKQMLAILFLVFLGGLLISQSSANRLKILARNHLHASNAITPANSLVIWRTTQESTTQKKISASRMNFV